MSIRNFIFCDICNPQALRAIEYRRSPREGERNGRRLNDGRAWFEGEVFEAIQKANWIVTTDGNHVCPNCQSNFVE